jgi:hypothetical protein
MVRTCVTRFLVACSAAALLVSLAPRAHAQGTQEQTTFITFSQPVSLPGITLPAGRYLFRHLPPDIVSHRHVVQVLSADRSRIYATLLTIPNQQFKPSGQPFVLFHERPASSPAAVQAWFYPGDPIGDEFVYPPAQARQIAEANQEKVLSSPGVGQAGQPGPANETAERQAQSLERAPVTRVVANAPSQMAGNTAPANPTPSPSSKPQSTNANPAASQTPSQPANQPPPNPNPTPNPNQTPSTSPQPAQPAPNAPRQLPRTASSLWLFGLIAVLAPLGAFGLRRLRSQL